MLLAGAWCGSLRQGEGRFGHAYHRMNVPIGLLYRPFGTFIGPAAETILNYLTATPRTGEQGSRKK
jgi:hypothetical protein